jgi:hypothetical protein
MLLLPCAERAAHAGAERPACGVGAGGMLTELACDVGTRAAGLAPGAAVIGLTPGAPSIGPAIGVRLAVRVALALGPRAAAWPYVESAEHARALRHGTRPLVLVRARLDGERLAVDVEIVGPETAGGSGPTLDRFVVKRPVDAEGRAFLSPVRFAATKVEPVAGSDSDVLALACADVRHDGPFTLAALGRGRVTLGALNGNRYDLERSRRLSELAAVAPVPLREPLASVTFTPGGESLIGISDRESALRLDATFARSEALPGVRLPWPGGGCARLDELFVAPRVERCAKSEPPNVGPSLREPLDAIAGANVTGRAGRVRTVRAGRLARDGSVVMTDGEREVRLEHAGAQLAVADLDGDGEPELVTSLDTPDPAQDAVVVYAWRGTGLEEKLRVPVSSGVRALAVCPQRPAAPAPIVVATSSGLGVIR